MRANKRMRKWLCGALGAFLLGSASVAWLGADCRCAAVRSDPVSAAPDDAQPRAVQAVATVRYTEPVSYTHLLGGGQ